MTQDPHQIYWRKNIQLIRLLLIIWGSVSLLLSILLVNFLNLIPFGDLPFGFWLAQQGSIFVFVILIFVYAVQMDRLERRYLGRQSRDKSLDP